MVATWCRSDALAPYKEWVSALLPSLEVSARSKIPRVVLRRRDETDAIRRVPCVARARRPQSDQTVASARPRGCPGVIGKPCAPAGRQSYGVPWRRFMKAKCGCDLGCIAFGVDRRSENMNCPFRHDHHAKLGDWTKSWTCFPRRNGTESGIRPRRWEVRPATERPVVAPVRRPRAAANHSPRVAKPAASLNVTLHNGWRCVRGGCTQEPIRTNARGSGPERANANALIEGKASVEPARILGHAPHDTWRVVHHSTLAMRPLLVVSFAALLGGTGRTVVSAQQLDAGGAPVDVRLKQGQHASKERGTRALRALVQTVVEAGGGGAPLQVAEKVVVQEDANYLEWSTSLLEQHQQLAQDAAGPGDETERRRAQAEGRASALSNLALEFNGNPATSAGVEDWEAIRDDPTDHTAAEIKALIRFDSAAGGPISGRNADGSYVYDEGPDSGSLQYAHLRSVFSSSSCDDPLALNDGSTSAACTYR